MNQVQAIRLVSLFANFFLIKMLRFALFRVNMGTVKGNNKLKGEMKNGKEAKILIKKGLDLCERHKRIP